MVEITFEKPIVIISKCLGIAACRYDGNILKESMIDRLAPFVHLQPVCPEVEIGLGVPRAPIRIIAKEGEKKRLFQPETKQDFTEPMEQFARTYLDNLHEADGFILKTRSPSCAITDAKRYADEGNGPSKGKGSGFFAEQVCKQFGYAAIEDEGRLKNLDVRDRFLTKLFTLAKFRATKSTENHLALVRFHASNKYLFMAYHPLKLKQLGRIVANHEKLPLNDVYEQYEKQLHELLQERISFGSYVNVFQHMVGYFSKQLSLKERQYFTSLLNQYREKQVPKASVLNVLYSWVLRFEEEYLRKQSIFHPYPEALMAIADSGKGREIS